MQHARRRRRLSRSGQVALARWLLALAMLVGLGPAAGGFSGPVRAVLDDEAELTAVGPQRQPAVALDPDMADDSEADDPDADLDADRPGDDRAATASRSAAASRRAVDRAEDADAVDGADDAADADPARRPDGPAAANGPADWDGAAADVAPSRRAARPIARERRVAPTCSIERGAASFGPHDRLVMTYYYYWYDQESLADPALNQRPPDDPPIDWRDVAWHERQLLDMAGAGVDVALAVYWGTEPEWSMVGLERMVEARERLLAAGLRPPAIGLFFDTNLYATILPERPDLADLRTADGLDTLADQMGGFLEQVPTCHRARIDGRVLAFFWRADTEDGDRFIFDDRTFSGLNDLIRQRYDERLHYALEQTWHAAALKAGVDLGAADLYRWGAALNGPRFLGRTVAVGPGYDDRRIEGRPGYSRDRGDGAVYSRDLRSAVMSGSSWLLLETWNELWEGTAIAETEDSGRMYLGITARYAALFHQLGAERAHDAWFDLGSSEGAYLRRLADAPVEVGMAAYEGGRHGARPFKEDDDGTGYFHFAIDRRFGLPEPYPLTVLVEYYDEGDGSFALEYDSLDADAPGDGAYTVTRSVGMTDARTWRIARFELPDASLLGRQYDGAGDFRIHDRPGDDDQLHVFGRVRVSAAPAARPVPFGPESLTFLDPVASPLLVLNWSSLGPVGGYRVQVLPFEADIEAARGQSDPGFSLDGGHQCGADVGLDLGGAPAAPVREVSCRLLVEPDLAPGTYRWRVQAVSPGGAALGDASDWAYFVVARR